MNLLKTQILLVEDEEDHAEMVKRAFAGYADHFQLTVAGNLREARAFLSRTETQLVITDLLLPDGRGIDLLAPDQERKAYPVIVMTAHGDEKIAVEAMKAGALDYVVKSDEILNFMPRVAELALREWRHVTERKRTEEALRKSEDKIRAILNAMPDVLFVMDKDGKFLEYIAAKLGAQYSPPNEIIGKNVYAVFPGELAQMTLDHLEKTGRTGQTQIYEYQLQVQGQPHDFEARMVVGASDQVLCIIRDITERKQAEMERVRLEDRLRQAQKMESVGLLAGGIAHDFNNLLSPILGYTEMLLAGLMTGELQHQALQQIRRASERARQLTQQLLAFSRRQMLELKTVNLGEVITRFESMLRRTIREDIRIEVKNDPGLGLVRADVGQIEQVLMNLAINAQDAMPQGGVLTLALENIDLDAAQAERYPDLKPGAYIRAKVNDTGVGMSRETQEHLFEPFYTTKAKGKGTGLGLSTVYGIVKQHGGGISVHSEIDKGSSFIIYLPRILETAAIEEAVSKSAGNDMLPHGKETILVVEDDEMVRSLTHDMLSQLGYRVIASDGAENCFRSSRDYPEEIHLLLTDVILPKMNGKEIFERLSFERKDMKVLYMSGYTSDVIVHHGVLDEGVHFIQKPITLGVLSRKLREVLG